MQNVVAKIVLNFCVVFSSILDHVGQFGVPFGPVLGSLLDTFDHLGCLWVGFGRLRASLVVNLGVLGATWSSWGASGLVLGAFGHRLWSTWGSWVQLGRLGVALGSHLSGFDPFFVDFVTKSKPKRDQIPFKSNLNPKFHSQCVKRFPSTDAAVSA